MKTAFVLLALTLCLCLPMPASAEADVEYVLDDLFMTTAFPAGWALVTPEDASALVDWYEVGSPEVAADIMRSEGIYVAALSPEGDAMLRVIADSGDETVALYYDIERYTSAMRTAITNGFLARADWASTGYRYTEAEWTNRERQGRVLRLVYSVRYAGEIIARGRQAYTIRGGKEITLDLYVKMRRLTSDDERIFNSFLQNTAFPVSNNMPLLPAGLELASAIPEETNKAELTVRGTTSPQATVSAWMQAVEGPPVLAAQAQAAGSGAFRLDITLPAEGEFRLYIVAELEGYADSEAAGWISYEASRIPVSFTSYPEGDVYDAQIIISGKTISGVTIQCMEGDTNKKAVTGSDGAFSFKMDRTITGPRTIILSMTKDGYDNRRFDMSFNRQWHMEDYAKYLAEQAQSLSFANLTERAERYVGRLVAYSGEVLNVSSIGARTYVQLGLKKAKDAWWTDRIIAVAEGMDVLLAEGDSATLYIEVTTNTYEFPELGSAGDEYIVSLPAVTLLAYVKN